MIQTKINGREVVVTCYGSETDWLCRLTDTTTQLQRHDDSYSPPSDLGFIWFRESDNKWLASGMVNAAVFRDAESVDTLLDRIMSEVISRGDQLAQRIEFVRAEYTVTFDGEQGRVEFPTRAISNQAESPTTNRIG